MLGFVRMARQLYEETTTILAPLQILPVVFVCLGEQ